MEPSEIVNTLDSLLPRIRESGDPSDTLLKFATSQNLTPAQLEKLGQSFNIAKTLAHLEHSENRGRSFSTLDVPDMLSKYASFEPQEDQLKKAAAAAGFEKAASSEDSDHDPYMFHSDFFLASRGEAPRDIVEMGGYTVPVTSEFEKLSARMDFEVTKELALQHEFDCLEDARDEIEKLAHKVKVEEVSVKSLVEEAFGLFGDRVKSACEFFQKAASEKGISVEIPEAVEDRLYRDSTGYAKTLEKVANLLALAEATRLYIAENAEALEKKAAPGGVKDKEPETSGTSSKKPQRGVGSVSDAIFWDEAPEKYTPRNDAALDGKKVHKAIHQAMGSLWDNSPGYNKKQESRDESDEEAIFMSNLQKLVIQDSVISEASNDAIMNAANSIREADPEIVRAPGEFRWLLREALQYDMEDGNIPQHLVLELKKRRKATLENRDMSRREDRIIYS